MLFHRIILFQIKLSQMYSTLIRIYECEISA